MDNIEHIFKCLTSVFDPILTKHHDKIRATELKEWLFVKLRIEDSTRKSIQNLRVAGTIATDVLTGNINPETFLEKILNRKDATGNYYLTLKSPYPEHIQFNNACWFELPKGKTIVLADQKIFHEFYECAFSTVDHPKEGYVRCINFNGFFNYYVMMDENYKAKSLKMDKYLDLKGWNETFNLEIDFPRIPESNNVNMRGGKPLSWITRGDVVDDVLATSNPPVELAQRFGIPIKNSSTVDPAYYDVLVLIYYDPKYDDIVYQPCSIHADWDGGGFVSFKQNSENYGRTFNCSKTPGENMLERINISYPVISKGIGAKNYRANIVGRVNSRVVLEIEKILQETGIRLASL